MLCIDVLNLIPGTMVLEIDQARRICLRARPGHGPQKAVRQFYRTVRQLERLFIEAFERDSDWKPAPGTTATCSTTTRLRRAST